MHDFAVARQSDTGDDFIFPIQRQFFLLFIKKRIEEIEQISRKQFRRIAGQTAGHIMMRHQLYALMRRHFTGLRQFAIAALLDGQINQYCAGLHAFQHFFGDQFGGRAARNKRRANDNILLGNMFGDQSLLALLIIGAHFFGITAFSFAAIFIIGFHHDKCAP